MNTIEITDYLWGTVLIDDPILINLLNSKCIERLKWIGQHGPLNHISFLDGKISNVSRYEHSVGAMILTLKAGGTIDEAIAALLHDIMHTAFSHAFDFMTKSNAVSFHEKNKDSLLKQFSKELKLIIGDDWMRYLKESNWPLIKRNNPFAIDIADYTVRDAITFGMCTVEEAHDMGKQLIIIEDYNNRQLACKNIESANFWHNLSNKTDSIYMAPWNIALNHYLASGLKVCIKKKMIGLNDLKKVVNSTVEYDAFKCIMDTDFGEIIKSYNEKKWTLYDDKQQIPDECTIVGNFDVRHRIVNPPIIDTEYYHYNAVIEKKILAYY
jgi:HD superfamily phosphohydrolase